MITTKLVGSGGVPTGLLASLALWSRGGNGGQLATGATTSRLAPDADAAACKGRATLAEGRGVLGLSLEPKKPGLRE